MYLSSVEGVDEICSSVARCRLRHTFLTPTCMCRLFGIAAFLVLLSVTSADLHAQVASESEKVGIGGWATVGMGSGPTTISFLASTTLGRAWIGQGGATTGGTLFGGSQMSSVYVGGGRSHSGRWHHATLAVAPALVYGGRSREEPELSIGMIVTAQVAFVPLQPVGVGVFATAQRNSIASGFGVGLVLALIDMN